MHQKPMNQMHHGSMDPTRHQQSMHDFCKRYHHHLVQFETTDGHMYEGIIDNVDHNGVDMLIPVGEMERGDQVEDERQFGFGSGIPRRFRRFRRHRFPFFILRRLFFPFIFF